MTNPLALYNELTPFYHLLDPPEAHAPEAESFRSAIHQTTPSAKTLLELGAGAGHNAVHLTPHFECTLSDLSDAMLDRSRVLNSSCTHVQGDMRSLRLGRTFDAVLLHDAIVYMTTEEALREAIITAWEHTRPGGAVVIAPDEFKDDFTEVTETYEGDDGERALRCTEWSWDPDPSDSTAVTEYSFLLRENGVVRAFHEQHVSGLFYKATWREILESVGFQVRTFARPISEDDSDEVFVALRPG